MHVSLVQTGNRPRLHFEEQLPATQMAVWQAITRPDLVSQWMPVEVRSMELRLGGQGEILRPDGSIGASQVTRWEPEHRFGFRAFADGVAPGPHDTIVDFELHATDCEVHLTGSQEIENDALAPFVALGWQACFAALTALLTDRRYTLSPPTSADFERHLSQIGLPTPVIEAIPGGNRVRIERQTFAVPVASAWSAMTAGVPIRVGDFAPPTFTGASESGRISEVSPPEHLEYLRADGGRVIWQLHDHFASTKITLAVALPRTSDAAEAASLWQDHVEAIVARILTAD